MKHDIAHEEVQNEAIRKLASVVASLAASTGSKAMVAEVHAAVKLLDVDEGDGESAPVVPSEPEAPAKSEASEES